ncbi:uncharacterized protein K441DRAFT_682402 [Cenococcum geophilum 1.58]|uniref:Uncharacterized protein n=1 Tax=Cenococcum geophilum 1.58 TaxID=794803 RepID=A0ACC8EMZ7_9PEZI|nr:hypothetical protein K441DRAFT_682402 [Cenococcum geophilum 1.58]
MYEQFNLDVYLDENYEFDVCGTPDPPWDSHIDPAVPRNDLQNRPATLPLASVEESSLNPANSVTPFQQFLNIALPEDTLQRALQEDLEDSSGGICTNRPKQSRFPLESVSILKIWLEKHMENPYPTSQEKTELAAMAHLSVQQVSNWFVNHRQRQLPPKRQMSPMEAWLSSSSDDEVASYRDIRRALQNRRKKDTPMYDIEPRTKFSSFQIPSPPSDARSVSTGSISSISSISSTGSAFSQCKDAVLSGPPRRGRKRHHGLLSTPFKLSGQNDRNSPKKQKAASDVGSDTDGPSSDLNFQCTFCYKRLSSKTWKRHETTQHFPQHQWTCMKNGFRTAHDPLTRRNFVEGFLFLPKLVCIFCNSSDPDESHAVSCHRISQCLENPESDRTFTRKDHLVQHLWRFHNSSLSSFFLESWKSKTELDDDFEWNCGFCGDSLRGWDIRANHIAKHFRERKTMADWCSDRGV